MDNDNTIVCELIWTAISFGMSVLAFLICIELELGNQCNSIIAVNTHTILASDTTFSTLVFLCCHMIHTKVNKFCFFKFPFWFRILSTSLEKNLFAKSVLFLSN